MFQLTIDQNASDKIREISIPEYPLNLQNMHNPPDKLYIRGNLIASPEQKYLCIVGSRRSTDYGKSVVDKIVGGLRGYPISIVSGLAFGIDSLAHLAALEHPLHRPRQIIRHA